MRKHHAETTPKLDWFSAMYIGFHTYPCNRDVLAKNPDHLAKKDCLFH